MAAGASTASPPVLTPGSNHLNFEVWQDSVEDATYQRQLFIPRIQETERPYSKMHIRKYARMAANTLASTAVGTSLTYQDPVGVEVTFTPTGNYVATARSFNEDAATNVPFDSDLAAEMERALAEASDGSALTAVTSLTNFRGNAGTQIDSAMLRNATALLQNNTNGMIVIGTTTIYVLLDPAQHNAVMSMPEYANADVRGDDENPHVRGVWSKGGGTMLMYSTVLTVDANGANGVMWVPSAFAIGWNERSQVDRQTLELQKRIILFNHFGSGVRHDARAVALRTDQAIPA